MAIEKMVPLLPPPIDCHKPSGFNMAILLTVCPPATKKEPPKYIF